MNLKFASVRVALTTVIVLTAIFSFAQDGYLPYSAGSKSPDSKSLIYTNLELTAGYLPKTGNEAFKTSIGVNNLLFRRLGVYTSLEFGSGENNLTNIVGGSVTVLPLLYVWGGMDFFTENGVFRKEWKGTRKELGIGITPYKWSVFRIGWSSSVGLSLAAGVRIPLEAL
jgi:hypothetical protein